MFDTVWHQNMELRNSESLGWGPKSYRGFNQPLHWYVANLSIKNTDVTRWIVNTYVRTWRTVWCSKPFQFMAMFTWKIMIHQEVPYFQANPNFETDKSLVGGLDHVLFFHMLGWITPTDFHVIRRGWNHQPDHVTMLNHFEACAPTSLQHHWSEGNHPQGQRVNEVVGRFQIGELTTVFFFTLTKQWDIYVMYSSHLY